LNVPTANYFKVPQLIRELAADLRKNQEDTIGFSTRTHSLFEQIHPFSDGNGRVGRLILTAMLLKDGLASGDNITRAKTFLYYISKPIPN